MRFDRHMGYLLASDASDPVRANRCYTSATNEKILHLSQEKIPAVHQLAAGLVGIG